MLRLGSSRTILAYSAKFEASLPDQVETSTLTALLESVRSQPFVLFGDFHTLRQSQRGFLRVIRAYQERLRDPNIVIALETFRACDQHILDEYMSGQMEDAAKLLKQMDPKHPEYAATMAILAQRIYAEALGKGTGERGTEEDRKRGQHKSD